jgi:hypothetical protein
MSLVAAVGVRELGGTGVGAADGCPRSGAVPCTGSWMVMSSSTTLLLEAGLPSSSAWVFQAANVITGTVDLVGDIGRRVLTNLLPARRLRVSARKVKSPISRYHTISRAASKAMTKLARSGSVPGMDSAALTMATRRVW